MIGRLGAALLLIALIPLIGCDDLAKEFGYAPVSKTPKLSKQSANASPSHRFVLSRVINVGFDTQTGQLCRTWDWEPIRPAQMNPKTGETPEALPGDQTPTCFSLYQKYPTRIDPNDPSGLGQDSNSNSEGQ